MKNYWTAVSIFAALAGLVYANADKAPLSLGQFENQQDIGVTPKAGSALFNAGARSYEVAGGGSNIGSVADAFHFIFRKISGDFAFNADVRFPAAGGDLHRRAALMIRQSLAPDSPFAAVAIQGDGATALQYRPGESVESAEFRAAMKSPSHLRITRHWHEFTIYANSPGEQPAITGPIVVVMQDPVYLGLAVCSHNPVVLETAVFSNIEILKGASR